MWQKAPNPQTHPTKADTPYNPKCRHIFLPSSECVNPYTITKLLLKYLNAFTRCDHRAQSRHACRNVCISLIIQRQHRTNTQHQITQQQTLANAPPNLSLPISTHKYSSHTKTTRTTNPAWDVRVMWQPSEMGSSRKVTPVRGERMVDLMVPPKRRRDLGGVWRVR